MIYIHEIKVLEAIFGVCLNYKSDLRILIWPLEVPFFWSQRWALLAKVTVFGPQKERSRKEQEKKDELEKKKKDWEKMQDEKKKVEGGIGTDEDKQMQKDLTLEDLIKFVTTNEDPEESEV